MGVPSSTLSHDASGLGSLPNGALPPRLPRGSTWGAAEGHAAVNKSQRERAARYWLRKYGEPIDCTDLSRVAALSRVELNRLIAASQSGFEELADLLEGQADKLQQYLEDRAVRGTGRSLEVARQAYRGAALSEGDEARAEVMPFPFRLLAQHIARGRRIAASARTQAQRLPIRKGRAASRAPDLALGFACHYVAEWVRERHPSRRGELDGKTSWPDVVKCLEWHGHRFQRQCAGGDVYGAARRRAERFRDAVLGTNGTRRAR